MNMKTFVGARIGRWGIASILLAGMFFGELFFRAEAPTRTYQNKKSSKMPTDFLKK